jgi:Tc toxin complex TcA C-terminal TcB-binding domain
LKNNAFRRNPVSTNRRDDGDGDSNSDIATCVAPISAIAVSSGQNDSGVFELNFRDERYLPFEGAGADSTWELSLPQICQFNYSTIADVIITLRYTACEGGRPAREAAVKRVAAYLKSVEALSTDEGLFVAFDLEHDFSSEWVRFAKANTGPTGPKLEMGNLFSRMPFFVYAQGDTNVKVADLFLITSKSDQLLGTWALSQNDADTPLPNVSQINSMFVIALQQQLSASGDWAIKRPANSGPLAGGLWMILRLTVQNLVLVTGSDSSRAN